MWLAPVEARYLIGYKKKLKVSEVVDIFTPEKFLKFPGTKSRCAGNKINSKTRRLADARTLI